MAYIIPNATDTSTGGKYNALDQAEPDALDFEILGSRTSGVIEGCEVTAQSTPDATVNVAAGYVVLNNVAYSVAASANLALGALTTSNNRFDLVIARKSGDTVTITSVAGVESAANPSYPLSVSRLAPGVTADPTKHIDPATDVVLAAVYRSGATSVTSSRIVDKRAKSTSGIRLQGAVPSTSLGSDGDLYFKTTLTNGDSAGVYVKRSGAWQELAKAPIDPGVPVGAIIMWPATSAPSSAVWMEADGSAISRTTYATLYGVLGTTYGAGDSSTTFNLPDFRGHFLSGKTAARALGTRYGGANHTVSVAEGNLPAHTHGLGTDASMTTTAAHTHAIDHDHPQVTTASSTDSHTHSFSATTNPTAVTTYQGLAFNKGDLWGYMTTTDLKANTPSTGFNIEHTHAVSGTTGAPSGAGHTHAVDLPSFTGTSSSAGSHAHTLSGTTASTGSATPLSVEPSNYAIRYFIRYA
jgi:microcystin-dependent protein